MKAMKVVCFICVINIIGVFTEVQGTEAVSSTATNSTNNSSLIWKSYKTLSSNQSNGVVTLEIRVDTDDFADIHARIPSVVVKILNQAGTPTSAIAISANKTEVDTSAHVNENSSLHSVKDRRSVGSEQPPVHYTADDIKLVSVSPAVQDGKLRVAVFAENKEGKVLEAEQLKDTLEGNKDELSNGIGYTVESIYVGMPELPRRATVWDAHRNLFIGVLILIGVAVFVLILCLLCFYCCRPRKSALGSGCKKEPIKKPYAEEEMVELAPVIPLQCAPPQQHQPNGDGKRNQDLA